MQEDLSKLATFSTKIAEDEPLCIEIQDIKSQITENNDEFGWNKAISYEQSPDLKKEQENPKNNSMNYKSIQKRNSSKKQTEIMSLIKAEENLLLEEDEKINFKSFQILKVIGSGAFGKIFLVS
jgi:hypothetical protein